MRIHLSLSLPRDAATVPLVRHLGKHTLDEIGVEPGCIADVELAVTEACANVVRHAVSGGDYEVVIDIDRDCCEIRIIDSGKGLEGADPLERPVPTSDAESGRGITIMGSVVDRMSFVSAVDEGTLVHLVKDLSYIEAGAGVEAV